MLRLVSSHAREGSLHTTPHRGLKYQQGRNEPAEWPQATTAHTTRALHKRR